jgi:uncharacterized protein YecT (DUF1311 family)
MAQYLGMRGLSTRPAARQTGAVAIVALALAIKGSVAMADSTDCMGKARTQTEVNTCAAQIYQDAEHDLQQAFQKLRAKLRVDDIARLEEAERSWAAYRETECSFETSGTDGAAIHATFVAGCLAEKTRLRLIELNRVVNCDRSDFGCAHAPP